jgi:tetratricopeptide (TPR) repeat protein
MKPRHFTPLLLALALSAQAQQPASDKAIERYRQMLEKTPAEGTALDRLWKHYFDTGKTAELIEQYRTGGTFSSEMVLGLLLRKGGELEAAVAAFERAAALDAANPLPLLTAAKTLTEAGRAAEAAAALEKALALLAEGDARRVETLLQLGAAWLAAGDLARAGEAWEGAVKLNPTDLTLRRRLADIYAKNALGSRAVPHLEYVAANAPPAERALAFQQLARVHQGAGNQDDAIRALDSALALTAPDNWLRAELQSQLIRLHQRYHRVEELEARWKKAAEENPRDVGAHLQLIDLYERLGQFEDQRVWLEKVVLLLPRQAAYRHKLARLAVQMDRFGAATALYDQLLAEQPANADYVFERARLDVQRDATPEAEARIAALLAAGKNDETLRARALDFYEQHRLLALVEKHLTEDAAGGAPEAVSALARFYFAQRREADGLRTIERLVPARAPAAEQAAAHLRTAQILRGENNIPAAVAALEKAAALAPESREIQMLLGELQSTRGEKAAAQAAFERAFELSQTPVERVEADQKIFDTVRQPASATPGAEAGGMVGGLKLARVPAWASPRGSEPLAPLDFGLQQYLAKLQGHAVTAAAEEEWLRLARWQAWAGDLKPALLSAQKALEIAPQSIAAQEFIVRLHIAEGTLPAAVTALERLAELDPARRTEYRRRAGQLELQGGRVAEALVIFQQLATANPGSIDALTDLALALQRGDRWSDALEAWRRIYALSPISKKKEAFAPLLRALERLEMHGQAADLMLKAIETEPDEREQFAQFADLLAFCTRHDLLDWLRQAFERRRVLRADEYFTEMAVGRILKAAGNKAAAFEVLSDASYAAEDQAASLPELVREAEELRKLDAAVKLQAQLVRIAREPRPEHLEKLARLQERNFDLEDAAQTWDRIVAKYPRDAESMQHAIDFHRKWGSEERAVELLRKLRALDPASLRALAALAELTLESGRVEEAAPLFEELLRIAPVEGEDDRIRLPDLKPEAAAQLQIVYRSVQRQRSPRSESEATATPWSAAGVPARSDRDLRLEAVRQLGQLVRAGGDETARAAWIARWSAAETPASEALWALYHAGAHREALDLLERRLAREPADLARMKDFVWLALHTRQFARLGAWIAAPARASAERDFLIVALDQHLETYGRQVDPALLPGLFAEASQFRMWEAAKVFEKRGRLREAVQLGQRVFDAVTTQRAPYGVDLAGWSLRLGELDRARDILARSIRTTADSFDAPVFAALRASWLLLAPAERPAFAENYLAGVDAGAHPLHHAIASVLLHGLAGSEAAARADLQRLAALGAMAGDVLDDSATSGARRWAFLRSAGLRLISWKLEPLAAQLWERALADDALIELEGEPALESAREVRRRLQALRIAGAPSPEVAREMVEAFARVASRDGVLQLGETLAGVGAHVPAVLVHRQLWEADPGNAQLLGGLVDACRAAQDTETAEEAFARVVEGGQLPGNEVAQQDNLLKLADLLDSGGRGERARVLLGVAVEHSPRDSRLALRYAQLCERGGRPAEAIATYQRVLQSEPRNFAAQLGLATVLEQQGDFAGALKVLQKSTSSEGEARIAQLRARAGEIDEALGSLDRLPAPQNVWPSIHVATALAERGHAKIARGVLQSALDRNTDPRMRFPLQSKVIEMLAPEVGETAILRELRRLRLLAGEQPELLSSYFDFVQKQSARLDVGARFQEELRSVWAEGAGPVAAGLTLLAAELEAKDAAVHTTLDRLLVRDDLGEVWLGRIAEALRSAERHELAARVFAEMAAIDPADEEHVLDWARALHRAGKTTEAQAVLGRLEALGVLNDELAGRLAAAYATCGAPDRARLFFQQALRADPFARHYSTHLACARMQTAEGDFDGAKRTLRAAFVNPANDAFDEIVAWLVASGRAAQFAAEARDLGLSPARLTPLARALAEHWQKAGDVAQVAAVVEWRPEILESGVAARLRAAAQTARSFEALAAVWEKLVAQPGAPADLPAELARLYGAWAEVELEASNLAGALAHLQRGHKLQPGVFEVAFRLATVQAERSDRAGAIATLDSFLAASTDSAATARARNFLNQLKSGTRE